jgi:uncharacterized membrane protein YeiH
VLRSGLYAIPAIVAATIGVIAVRAGQHGIVFPLVGLAACFVIRILAIRYDLSLTPPADRRRLR